MIESEYLYDWKQLYAAPSGDIKIEVIFDGETFWLSQRKMAELFGKDIRTINEHFYSTFLTKVNWTPQQLSGNSG